MGVRLLGRAMLGQTVVAAIIYGFVGTDKSNDFDHFTYLGNFGPNRILFGKVVEVVRLIRSHIYIYQYIFLSGKQTCVDMGWQ